MADAIGVYTSNSLIYTGAGQLTGLVVTNSSTASSGFVQIFDNTAGSGTEIFKAHVLGYQPLVLFFSDRFAPRFATGLYIVLFSGSATLIATVWTRQV